MVRRHDIRHARYRGLPKVLRQGWLTALVVNLERPGCVLLTPADPAAPETVRAELAMGG